MVGRRGASAARRPGLRWLAGALGLALAALTILVMQPAGASPTTVQAQLSLSGVATPSSPTGGSVVGIHPGDSVTFSASAIPTAGFPSALSPILSPIAATLTSLAPYQVSADFSHLPAGATNTVLKGSATKTFTFPQAGTYSFTWQAQQVTLLGVVPIALPGNQLAAAGIKLNAQNQYVGQIVVADNPPSGGISLQLPGVSVAPSLPVVGQLPTVGVPNVTAPTLPVGVPKIAPGSSGSTSSGGSSSGGVNYTPPGLSIPEQVVPKGDGALAGPDLNADPNLALGGFGDPLPAAASQRGSTAHASGSGSAEPAAVPAGHSVRERPVEIASSPQTPSGQMPVILAIVAIIALSLVTATYARLYLLRRNS